MTMTGLQRWGALAVLCLGVLMIMLDTTIVNVALPSIQESLGFSDTGLAWVVNGYFLFFGGFLLLGGRLGDLYGRRTLFVVGIGVFTVASGLCALAQTPGLLVVARALQGFGGAVVTAVALALIMGLFTDPKERAIAMGVYGFVCAGGSSLGALLGGVLTGGFGWASIFVINLPVGVLVMGLSWWWLADQGRPREAVRLDLFGAVTGTAALMLAVYAIVNGNLWGWTSGPLLGLVAAAVGLFGLFLLGQMRARQPLLPLSLFRLRSVVVANLVVMLWAAALFTWFFMTSLYLHFVQGYPPMEIGLAFLPTNITMALLSLGASGLLINAFGLRWPLAVGLGLAAAGLFWLSGVPVGGDFSRDLLPAMLLFGLGAGLAVNPMLLAALCEVPERHSGLASGLVNTSFSMGGALWLAVFTSYAAWTTQSEGGPERGGLEALNSGYQAAFFGAACLLVIAALLVALGLKRPSLVSAPAAALE